MDKYSRLRMRVSGTQIGEGNRLLEGGGGGSYILGTQDRKILKRAIWFINGMRGNLPGRWMAGVVWRPNHLGLGVGDLELDVATFEI